MKSLIYPNVLAATELTRAGKLAEATRVLRGTMPIAARTSDVVRTPFRKPAAESVGQFLARSFSNAAGTRKYKLYVPTGYCGQPCPLIVMLHGCSQSADDFAAGTLMNEIAEKQTFLVAYPEQPASANASKCWNWFNSSEQHYESGEPSIIAGITRQIQQKYAVDLDRTYVAGLSAGGAEAAILGAVYADIYAAIGVHSGLARGSAHDLPSAFAAMKCAQRETAARARTSAGSNRFAPTIVFHGDRDATVHPSNADLFESATDLMHCRSQVYEGRVAGGHAYTRTVYTDHRDLRLLERWVVHGGKHAWSGGSVLGSFTDPKGPDASAEMVRFFLSHRRDETAETLRLTPGA